MRLPPLALVLALLAAVPTASGCGEGDPIDPGADAAPPPLPVAPLRIRRLLDRQYVNTVRDLLGPQVAEVAAPPGNVGAHGFDTIGAATLALSPTGVRRYEQSARQIAERVMLDLGTLSPYLTCQPAGTGDEACMRSFVERFGRRAFRRPLAEEEIERYLELGLATAEDFGTFYAGVEYVVSAFLQSPSFLYMIEIGEPIPDQPGRVRLTGHELATRLSFFLADTTPSEELLQAAEAGELDDADGVRAVARQLLERPEARAALEGYYAERFRLRDLAGLSKDPEQFPDWDHELAASLRQEALELLGHIVWEEDADYRELFTARYAYVNADLAALYGVAPPEGAGFERRELPAGHGRRGVVGQGGFLALHAHPGLTSPTRRGRFITERLLCGEVPPPPPDVVPELPEDPGRPETMREKLERHMEDPACASCHVKMDPVGLALEHFDPIGRWRADDRGLPLDVAGESEELGSFQGADELGELLAGSEAVHRCWVRNLYRHATGHVEFAGERVWLRDLTDDFAAGGYRVRDLLVELVASEGFRHAGAHEEGN